MLKLASLHSYGEVWCWSGQDVSCYLYQKKQKENMGLRPQRNHCSMRILWLHTAISAMCIPVQMCAAVRGRPTSRVLTQCLDDSQPETQLSLDRVALNLLQTNSAAERSEFYNKVLEFNIPKDYFQTGQGSSILAHRNIVYHIVCHSGQGENIKCQATQRYYVVWSLIDQML